MTLRQQIRVLAIDLLVGDEKITPGVSRAHADIVPEVDHKVSQIPDVSDVRLESRFFVYQSCTLCPLEPQVRKYNFRRGSAS